ncbi:MAG: ABC transporter permease [Paenirhodobacter sp.]|uniref:ABC transporter permease n=1 Tax=Paenirhodobacter sp. TaxID=1965326 RepID=UPI003D0D6F33
MTETSIPLPQRKRRLPMARAVFALMLREMSTTYGRSPGGYFWAIAEPVAAIGLLSVAFSMFMRHPQLGTSFVLFYASGFLPLAAYQAIAANVGNAIRFSRPLLAYPTVTYVDAIVARLMLTVITQVVIFVIVVTGAMVIDGVHVNIDYIALLRALGMIMALGTAMGLLNCYLMSMFPIWQYIWSVLNRPMFLVSGVLYLVDNLPEQGRNLALMIPPTHFIMMTRVGFYDTYGGAYVSEAYVYGFSLIFGALGMLLLHRYHRKILSEPN